MRELTRPAMRQGALSILIVLMATLSTACQQRSLGDGASLEASAVVDNPYGLEAQWVGGGGAAGPSRAYLKRPDGEASAKKWATLAYEHTVNIELRADLLPDRVRDLQKACGEDRKYHCTLLDVATESALGVPNGSVRLRLAPAGVETFVGLAAQDGKITGRNTHAEDLAEPVADAARQLALLTVHRDRLDEFLKSKDLKVDQVITVSKELATVQAQLEETATRQANLQRRLDTELLTIYLTVPRTEFASAQHEIRDAVHSMGSSFRGAVATVITFLASVLPWLVAVVIPGLILLRLFWRWMSRWIARRESRG